MRGLAVRSFAIVTTLALCVTRTLASASIQAFTDNIAYNVGSTVQLKVVSTPSEKISAADIRATIHYAGENKAVLDNLRLAAAVVNSNVKSAAGYSFLWQIPSSARLGRYEIDLVGLNVKSHETVFTLPNAASFVVYKKLVHIDAIKLDKTFYTSGDPVSATFTIENQTRAPLTGLRVEFSNRYWPWIGGPADAAKASVVTLEKNLTLAVGAKKQFHAAHVEVADEVKQPSTHQYGIVVWDQDRKKALDIAFSPLAFIHPPGVTEPKPFSGWYLYPTLSAVNTDSYRHFYPGSVESAGIQFDHTHTMFAAGGEAVVEFSVKNPSPTLWKGISIRYRAMSPEGAELAHQEAVGPVDLPTGASSAKLTAHFGTAPETSGLYRIEVEVANSSGDILAASALELGINPLPKSILIFCAHEDDEGGYTGLTRAAVENHIPIHFVYFTSGDAGSCDVYYEHSCEPADALNFGGLRMDEVRASLGHLGVPPDDILFIGLPDGASGQIWYDNINSRSPFLDPLLATDHAPYEGMVEPNLPYARDAVVETVEKLIRKYQPEWIATPHPGQVTHIDHIVNNYFVVAALQKLERGGSLSPHPSVIVDGVRDPKTQPNTPYRYLDFPLYVSGDAASLAQESRWYYLSQGGSRGEGNLTPFDKLERTEKFRQVLDWNEHAGWNDKRVRAVH